MKKLLMFLIIALISIVGVVAIPLGTNLSAYWQLEQTVNATQVDTMGNYNLTFHRYGLGGTTTSIPGIAGNGLNFIESSANGSIYTYLDSLQPGNVSIYNGGPFTISTWVNTTFNDTSQRYWFTANGHVNGSNSRRGYIWFGLNTTGVPIFTLADVSLGTSCQMSFPSGTGIYQMPGNINIRDGLWHNIILEYDGNTMMAFLDNVMRTNITLTGPNGSCVLNFTFPVTIYTIGGRINLNTSLVVNGGFYGSLDNTYNGAEDEVAIWNRALTSNEINYTYSQGLSGLALNTSFDANPIIPCTESWQLQYVPSTCPSNSQWMKLYNDANSCNTTNTLPIDNGTLFSCVYVPPVYNNQTFDGKTTTNINNVTNITAVDNFTVASTTSAVQWTNPVNLENVTSVSDVVTTSSSFISVDTAAAPTLNTAADVALTVPPEITNQCSDFTLYYAIGIFSTGTDIINNGRIVATGANVGGSCSDATVCTNVQCTNGVLTFTAQHFDAFSLGSIPAPIVESCQNTRQTIYAGFAILAVLILAGAAAMLLLVFRGGGDGTTMMIATIGFIATAIAIMVGYFIISQIPGLICG